MFLQMIADISKLSGWLALIAAIAGPAVAWGVLTTKIDNLSTRIDSQDKLIAQQQKDMAELQEQINETDIQFAKITTLIEKKILPNLEDINLSVRHYGHRLEKLMDNLINKGNDKKGNS